MKMKNKQKKWKGKQKHKNKSQRPAECLPYRIIRGSTALVAFFYFLFDSDDWLFLFPEGGKQDESNHCSPQTNHWRRWVEVEVKTNISHVSVSHISLLLHALQHCQYCSLQTWLWRNPPILPNPILYYTPSPPPNYTTPKPMQTPNRLLTYLRLVGKTEPLEAGGA